MGVKTSWGIAATIVTFIGLTCIQASAIGVLPQPKTNIWVTLVNKTGQDSMCLSLSTPGNPFSTCLVRILVAVWPTADIPSRLCDSSNDCVDNWDGWSAYLPCLPAEPQELELLGSLKMDSCLYFNYTGRNRSTAENVNSSLSVYKMVQPGTVILVKNFPAPATCL